MPAKSKPKAAVPGNPSANLGFEAKPWLAADKLRNNMDAAEPTLRDTLLKLLSGELSVAGATEATEVLQ